MSTAAIVPSCVTAVNAAPGSSQPRKAGTMRRWAVLEIGRNSVIPCTMPRTIAWRMLTVHDDSRGPGAFGAGPRSPGRGYVRGAVRAEAPEADARHVGALRGRSATLGRRVRSSGDRARGFEPRGRTFESCRAHSRRVRRAGYRIRAGSRRSPGPSALPASLDAWSPCRSRAWPRQPRPWTSTPGPSSSARSTRPSSGTCSSCRSPGGRSDRSRRDRRPPSSSCPARSGSSSGSSTSVPSWPTRACSSRCGSPSRSSGPSSRRRVSAAACSGACC